ncbi:LrgB family protein [Effusibacillus dendaii]|uniref:LrgB family protein n=1 Tax=Effusibacillus dendaii TaxID=2743772 RepID=A0A7I8DF76_9BACL|nr:LrgB family protein [Effusibacillus dendaii]BCJ87952.1 hypothetical protein skT53_29370 [Effusibacillus dendaii]
MIGIISLITTIAVYYATIKIYRRWSFVWLSPMITSVFILVLFLSVTHVSYTDYLSGAKWLNDMLGPATVAFAIPLYKYSHLLKKYGTAIVASLLAGAFIAIISTALLGKCVHLSPEIIHIPK